MTVKWNCFFWWISLVAITSCASRKEVYMFTSFHEPVNEGLRLLYSDDGYHWNDLNRIFLKPEVGSKVMRDPSIVKGPDKTYHLVWTCGWKGDKGFGYANSKDLIHWSPEKFIPVMEHEPTTVNVWAPELYYDNKENQFIIIWASTIPFRFPKGIEEEENNHRMYYTTTKDFNAFSESKLFFDPGYSVIDAVILKERENDYALLVKDNTRPNRNIKVAFGKNALGPYTGTSEPFTESFTEGPTVVKVNDEWIIYYDAYKEKKYGAVKTKDFRNFTAASKEISIPEGHKHGTIFKIPKSMIKTLLKN